MSTTALPSAPAPARVGLGRAAAAMQSRRRAEVELLEAVLEWSTAHTVELVRDAAGWRPDTVPTPGTSAAALFGDRALPIAGEGAPLVAEFAVMELAAVLDLSHEAALCLVGDVLDLAHRLPRLWGLVTALRVSVRVAREAARVSRDLDPAAAAHADRLLVWQPGRLNPHRVGVLVHEARLYGDPDRAIADHDHALASRRVEVHHGEGAPGTSAVFMTLDTADAVAFDHTVSTMAATMSMLGHPADLGARRAHAVGVLADPQRALDLLAAADLADPDRPIPPEDDPAVCVAEDAAHEPADPFRHPTGVGAGRGGGVHLVLHVTDRDLLMDEQDMCGPRGIARSDQLGPMLLGRLRSWLVTADRVTIQPVIDLPHIDDIPAVDVHDPPARMAAAVRLRDTTCVFPACRRPSEACDLDHTIEYVDPADGGPPGQTHPANLAPLCRRHHRAKTFGGFTYHRLPDGSYQWTLPTGRIITTDPLTERPRPGTRQRTSRGRSETGPPRPTPPC